MARRCDRPTCSELAAVAYGFDSGRLLVWLDAFVDDDRAKAGGLCLRHADRLTAPRGWWIDDRRVAVPELFRGATKAPADELVAEEAAPPKAPRRRRRSRRETADEAPVPEEVATATIEDVPLPAFGEDIVAGSVVVEETLVLEDTVEPVIVEGDVVVDEAIVLEEAEVADDPLLSPTTPLLARAFSGTARPDGPRRRSRRNPKS